MITKIVKLSMPSKSWKYEAMKKSLINKYGLQAGLFLTNRVAKAIRQCKDECLDNFRFADIENIDEYNAYQKAKNEGCCGYWDQEVVFKHKFHLKVHLYTLTHRLGPAFQNNSVL